MAKTRVITVEFEISVPKDASFKEIENWVQFELCGGSIQNELFERMGDWEPDWFSVNIDA